MPHDSSAAGFQRAGAAEGGEGGVVAASAGVREGHDELGGADRPDSWMRGPPALSILRTGRWRWLERGALKVIGVADGKFADGALRHGDCHLVLPATSLDVTGHEPVEDTSGLVRCGVQGNGPMCGRTVRLVQRPGAFAATHPVCDQNPDRGRATFGGHPHPYIERIARLRTQTGDNLGDTGRQHTLRMSYSTVGSGPPSPKRLPGGSSSVPGQ